MAKAAMIKSSALRLILFVTLLDFDALQQDGIQMCLIDVSIGTALGQSNENGAAPKRLADA
jgi:hypothetical protein